MTMTDNYERIVRANLQKLYTDLPADLAENLPARQVENRFEFDAFGERCVLSPEGISLGTAQRASVLGILISLYALHACPDRMVLTPFKAFKDLPNSAPYLGAFTTHTEQPLCAHAGKIAKAVPRILEVLGGETAPPGIPGDFSFVVRPLPKISLCYIFYEADEDFPASVKCLFSSNAGFFLPVEGLADTGEFTSARILNLIGASP